MICKSQIIFTRDLSHRHQPKLHIYHVISHIAWQSLRNAALVLHREVLWFRPLNQSDSRHECLSSSEDLRFKHPQSLFQHHFAFYI